MSREGLQVVTVAADLESDHVTFWVDWNPDGSCDLRVIESEHSQKTVRLSHRERLALAAALSSRPG